MAPLRTPDVPLHFHTGWVCSHRYFWEPRCQCCGCGCEFWGLLLSFIDFHQLCCCTLVIYSRGLKFKVWPRFVLKDISTVAKGIFFFFFAQHLKHFSTRVAHGTERDGADFPKLKIQTVMEIHRNKSIERFLLGLYQIQKSLLFLSCSLSSSLPARESGVKEFNIKPGGLTDFGGERGRWFLWKSLSGSISGIDKAISGILLQHRLCCKSKKKKKYPSIDLGL